MSLWFYTKEGEQNPPVPEEVLVKKLKSGELAPEISVWTEGMADWQRAFAIDKLQVSHLAHPAFINEGVPESTFLVRTQPVFLYIPVSRLVVMSIISGGLFEAYWMYKNWQYLVIRDKLRITPLLQSFFFGIFFMEDLLKRIHSDVLATALVKPGFSPGLLTLGWVLSILVGFGSWLLGDSFWGWICAIPPLLSVLFLIPVQKYLNKVNEQLYPPPSYYQWSGGQIAILVISLLFILMTFFGGMAEA